MSAIVPSLYRSVIDDVISSVRDVFLDDGIDEQILTELKQTWERKLVESKGMDPPSEPVASGSGGSAANTQTAAPGQNISLNNIQRVAPNASTENSRPRIVQVDGPNSSDEDDDEDGFDDDGDEHDDDEDDQNDEDNDGPGEEEEPLNSEDDVSDEDPTELFETDNVVVCQYDKITRSRNKWKFHLKDGIMNLQGRDYVFQKAIGDAEW